MTGPTLTQKEFRNLKGKLTRAINSKDPAKIIETVDHAFQVFEEKGYPDNWRNWEVAGRDAKLELLRRKNKWRYNLHSGDEIKIDTGDNEITTSVIIRTIKYIGNTARITTDEGETIECLVSEIH